MSENEFNPQFFEQFLDDYYAESDEHLRRVRRHLMALEDSWTIGASIKQNILNDLFRSFHTLKGISAMANVTPAENLAHHMEDYLRLLREDKIEFSAEGLEALISCTKKLFEIVEARQAQSELPPIAEQIRILETLAADNFEAGRGAPPVETAESELTGDGQTAYLFTFIPSPELAGRDVNVNTVRERLERFAVIKKSTPVVRAGGKIAFEFSVETEADENSFAELAADGISYTKIASQYFATVPPGGVSESTETVLFSRSNVVRVDLPKLDQLMLMVGELVISRAKFAEHIKRMVNHLPSAEWRDLQEINQQFERQLRQLRDGVMRVRMIPIGEIFERMQFAVRDLARENGKRLRLEISGENTKIDKLLVERMPDPLLHLIRNAVSHGIETPAAREAAGKTPEGRIGLNAATIGETVVIEITDDGNGIDRLKTFEMARQYGFSGLQDETDDAALLDLLCTPGFSTRKAIDKTSGRGVGMDVVKRTVEELGGSITLQTAAREGTKFRIRLPLTLAIADALIVGVDEQRFAVHQANVSEVIEIEPGAVRKFENNEIIEYRGAALPIVRLARLFDLGEKYRNVFHAFVVGEGKQAVGIAVDRVIGHSEIVVRAINDPLVKVPGISGATELGDGRVVLILDVNTITQRLRKNYE